MTRSRAWQSPPPLAPYAFPENVDGHLPVNPSSDCIPRGRAPKAIGRLGLLLLILLLVAGCNPNPTPTPTPAATPLPALALNATSGSVRASGNIEPTQKAELAFPGAGRVERVDVAVGETVADNAVLITLSATAAEAALIDAQSALFQAQATLEDMSDGARREEIEYAQAQVDAAEARLAQLAERARPEEVAAAEAEVDAAEAAYRQLFNGPREADRIVALADLSNAKAAAQQAQSAYNLVSWRNDVSALAESRKLQEATNNLESAQARHDALFASPDADIVAEAKARVQQAKAALDRILTPGSENEVAEAAAQVRSARAQFDLLTAGARDGEIAAAAMAVTRSEAILDNARAVLEDMTLSAPFAGVVTAIDVNAGEMVQPGDSVLTLANLGQLRMETSDLSERDVARVALGQAANIFVKPLNEEFPGRVIQISPQASIIGGDIVYTVVIEFDEQPANLRWGMSADVEILAD